jgi:exopolyphosphatase/guanosine-5'-triphosphate,3'-diphosphate pyrophosphatase
MADDPPSTSMLKQMESEVSDRLSTEFHSFHKLVNTDTSFIGTAGTITTLSAINQKLSVFKHDSIHNSSITLESIKNVFLKISSVSSRERAQYIPFEAARLDIIVPGTLILLKLMEFFNFSKITVSNYGLREGIILDMFNKHRK